ncbi:hypothetical protein, partial [Actinomadura fibrosa]|uniref:hypothetical protein n=1 Tax=Actinomadura fibrosa TaxID=111802 RepID=UPI001A9558D1
MSEPWTDRRPSLAGRLARLGFTDAGRAGGLILEAEAAAGAELGNDLLEALGATADPDLALDGLLRLLEAGDGIDGAAADDRRVRPAEGVLQRRGHHGRR